MKMMACIASGPSLTKDDCDLIEASGIPTIAVNNSWEMARFAKYIYAGDKRWWTKYIDVIDIPAQKWTCSGSTVHQFGIHHHKKAGAFNTGMRAIQFAIHKGAKRIILLGYDCSIKHGIHWHGPHQDLGNPNPNKTHRWQRQFEQVAMEAERKKVNVINCSRHTALKCFKRMKLEDCLGVIDAEGK